MDIFGITEILSKCIIRPPRAHYSILDLGSKLFQINNKNYFRDDFSLQNHNNYQIECSLYTQLSSQNNNEEKLPRPLLIFLHANSASRLSVKNYLKDFLPHFDVLGFDFSGSGLSQGNWTTLGYHQKQDLKIVIDFLMRLSKKQQKNENIKGKLNIKQIILWGRSMGAVTSILFMSKYQEQMKGLIKAMVLDSPFSNLLKLVNQLADNYLPLVPNFVVNSVVQQIQQKITQILNQTPINNQNPQKYKNNQKNQIQIPLNAGQRQLYRQYKYQRKSHQYNKPLSNIPQYNQRNFYFKINEQRKPYSSSNSTKQQCSMNYERNNLKIRPLQKFNISKLSPIDCISKITVPIFFITGKDDKLVSYRHTTLLYEKARTIKELQIIQGGHNDARPDHLKNNIIQFLLTKVNRNLNENIRLQRVNSKKKRGWFQSKDKKINDNFEIVKQNSQQELLKKNLALKNCQKNYQQNKKLSNKTNSQTQLVKKRIMSLNATHQNQKPNIQNNNLDFNKKYSDFFGQIKKQPQQPIITKPANKNVQFIKLQEFKEVQFDNSNNNQNFIQRQQIKYDKNEYLNIGIYGKQVKQRYQINDKRHSQVLIKQESIKISNSKISLARSIIEGQQVSKDKDENQKLQNTQGRRKIFISPKTKQIMFEKNIQNAKNLSKQIIKQKQYNAYDNGYHRKISQARNINKNNYIQKIVNKQEINKEIFPSYKFYKKNNKNFNSDIIQSYNFKLSQVQQTKSIFFDNNLNVVNQSIQNRQKIQKDTQTERRRRIFKFKKSYL